jgi:hypothetical protein
MTSYFLIQNSKWAEPHLFKKDQRETIKHKATANTIIKLLLFLSVDNEIPTS